jgi:hypothetical protein
MAARLWIERVEPNTVGGLLVDALRPAQRRATSRLLQPDYERADAIGSYSEP